ncbi:hypothetical protein EZV62_014387 [Acer yangbiense]|uniref:Uncharacterized protein n=1 Tax=Acer yangbiense TaxID=1000413 RepID=A0A5C7HSP3_9ROSI|nr:hypothetical protein EZV62_014387 [Acer yangbiense]
MKRKLQSINESCKDAFVNEVKNPDEKKGTDQLISNIIDLNELPSSEEYLEDFGCKNPLSFDLNQIPPEAEVTSRQQGDKSLSERYGVLEGLWGELNSYHHATTDNTQIRKQREELVVVRSLSSLNLFYESAKNNILTEKELPIMKEIYARLQRLSVGISNSYETSALVSSGGRGRGQSFGRGRGTSLDSKLLSSDPLISSLVIPSRTQEKPLLVYSHRNTLPIGDRSQQSTVRYPLANFVSFDALSCSCRTFALSLSTVSLPRDYHEALTHPG